MQLKLKRSQREGGIVGKSVIFCLDARVEFTPEERANLLRHKLHNQVIYNSAAAEKHLARGEAHEQSDTWGGIAKSLAHSALAAMKLNITVASLEKGQHVECKDMAELLAAEEAVKEACSLLRRYLDTAATFDGREMLFDFTSEEPQVVATAAAPTPQLVVSSSSAPPPEPMHYQPALAGDVYASQQAIAARASIGKIVEGFRDTLPRPLKPYTPIIVGVGGIVALLLVLRVLYYFFGGYL